MRFQSTIQNNMPTFRGQKNEQSTKSPIPKRERSEHVFQANWLLQNSRLK